MPTSTCLVLGSRTHFSHLHSTAVPTSTYLVLGSRPQFSSLHSMHFNYQAILPPHHLHFLRQGLSLNPELTNLARPTSQSSSCVHLSRMEISGIPNTKASTGSGASSSDPQTCTINATDRAISPWICVTGCGVNMNSGNSKKFPNTQRPKINPRIKLRMNLVCSWQHSPASYRESSLRPHSGIRYSLYTEHATMLRG